MTNKDESIILTEEEIFTQIWFSPRKVFKYIDENKFDKYVYILLFLAGIVRAFDRASIDNTGNNLSLLTIVLTCIILGGLLGWISFYIYAALLSWTGEWLNGRGSTKSLLRMLSYSMIPSVIALLFLIPQILLFGNEIFQSNLDINVNGMLSVLVYYSTSILEIALGIWTLVLLVIGISEVQKISIWNAILNMILPGIIIIVPIMIIILTIYVFGD